jgi:uncharacterized protein DUF4019
MTDQAPVPTFAYEASPPNRKLWKWSIVVAAVVLLLLTWQCGSALVQGPGLSNRAVRRFHQQLNNRQYEEIYQEADARFAEGGKHEELVKLLEGVHTKLGDAGSETLLNIRAKATTDATAMQTQYNTTFAKGTAVETFTWIKEHGRLRLYGYTVESKALLVN